ncbi:MAG: Kelch repeat-containing protein [Chitinophagaceae bacterium]
MQCVSGLFLCLFFPLTAFSQPNPRHLEEVTYDLSGNKLLVFGGIEIIQGGWIEPVMVYEWNGKNWHSNEVKGPVGRRGHVWVYDESRKETLLIGGVTTGHIVKDSLLFDVWAWDGSKWKLINSTCPVKEPEGIFDRVNKSILVYGEANHKNQANQNLPAAFELWELKNNTWKKLSTDGPDITGSRMLAFDAGRKRLVVPVFEQNGMTVWEWAGKEWIKAVFEKEAPAYRSKFSIGYDPVDKVTVLFGGLSADRVQLGDFWKWDGKKWKRIETKHNPVARNSAHFASGTDQLILFGGSIPRNAPEKGLELSNELWLWKNKEWILIN